MKKAKRGAVAQCKLAPGQQLFWATMLGGIFALASVQIAGNLLG